MTTGTLSILLLEDEPADAEVVRRFLRLSGGAAPTVTVRSTLAEGLEAIEGGHYDLILLDLGLPDSADVETFDRVRARCGPTPLVILTGNGDEEHGATYVRRGAQDFLIKGRFDAPQLMRVVRFTVERARLIAERDAAREQERLARDGEQRERELRLLAELALPPTVEGHPEGARMSLHEAAPTYFAALVDRYGDLLEGLMERRIYRMAGRNLGQDLLRALATELAARLATPRDVLDVHTAALQAKIKGKGQGLAQGYAEEARILLIEVLGYVLAAYRGRILTQAPAS